MDYVKEAFQKVKQDILDLKQEKNSLELSIAELKDELAFLRKSIENRKEIETEFFERVLESKKEVQELPTDKAKIKTELRQTPVEHMPFGALNHQNIGISTGNDGVPTDRQTDRQTDRHIIQQTTINQKNSINNALELIQSLDIIKKEIRLKFKRLTEQEWLVFSTIYQLDEEKGFADYKVLSERLNLTESSIRDYVGRLIKKEVPLDKIKVNNKSVRISISKNLKKIANLPAILQLREL